MTQVEKLQEIIKYAISRGYCLKNTYLVNNNGWNEIEKYHKELFIFSHKFLKAFFGEKVLQLNSDQKEIESYNIAYHDNRPSRGEACFVWQNRVQQLVILPEEKRIDYLYDFLKEGK